MTGTPAKHSNAYKGRERDGKGEWASEKNEFKSV